MTARYGLPYFQNFVNSDLKPNMIRSMCCRLQLDLRELLKRGNGLFGRPSRPAPGRGDHQLRAPGLPVSRRRGRLLAGWTPAGLGRDTWRSSASVIQQLMDEGLFPYTKRYLGTLRNHFSTLGVNGINEMIRNFSGDAHDITTKPGTRWRCACSTTCARASSNSRKPRATCTTWRPRRPKAPPTASPRRPQALARHPAGRHGRQPYYTNSSQLPVGFTDDPFEALARRSAAAKYTGGTVLHLYMGERCPAARPAAMVRRALERFRLPYITITPTFSVCPKHGYLAGEHASARSATRTFSRANAPRWRREVSRFSTRRFAHKEQRHD
jgi:ribonucleoside-triphosphate reductase